MLFSSIDTVPTDLPGQWTPQAFVFEKVSKSESKHILSGVQLCTELVSKADCSRLITQIHAVKKEEVGVYGYKDKGSGIGSLRATGWSSEVAHELWKIFSSYIQHERVMKDDTPTDWFATAKRKEHRHWRAVGVSPLLRCMQYHTGGEHYGHYDMGYDYGDGRRTLVSYVLFLNDINEGEGGELRFLETGQSHIPIAKRNFADWPRRAYEHEVIRSITPCCGSVLFFDHRICHDVSPYLGSQPRYILRGDIIFFACEDGYL